ncbi:helix-turn-helix domain-containing protein [Rhizobium sp. TRM95796]|uniref:helix-turn-helix domain-containing protein n=1 Tax=Rhizobium sp. TRM95796 TaxID=2979862 RepID=UPI0021E74C69|nr:helix-turn-helix domain-containing protein [Rhizobium sp. TRM95796]MCV3766769.1 helix-turn-helix domain-containing protein [Rhizobium sp. TRM95796]
MHMLAIATPGASPATRRLRAASKHNHFLEPRQTLPIDATTELLTLESGCLALSHYLPDGRRQISDIVGPGRVFSIGADCRAESLTYSSVMPADMASDAYASQGRLMLARMQAHALLLGRKTAAERVATAVLDLARQFAPRDRSSRPSRATFILYPTRADLADWLGLTIETISRTLNSFKRTGLIGFDRPERITILNQIALERTAGGHAA